MLSAKPIILVGHHPTRSEELGHLLAAPQTFHHFLRLILGQDLNGPIVDPYGPTISASPLELGLLEGGHLRPDKFFARCLNCLSFIYSARPHGQV